MEASLSRPRSEANEVPAKAQRRRFTTDEKVRILKEADSCTKPGELGALLRREGLYSSHLAAWRLARQRGDFGSGVTKKRGPKKQEINPLAKKVVELEKANRRLQFRAERAEALVELQKKVAELLGRPLNEKNESD